MAIPLFIIAGGLMDKGGVSKRLVRMATSLVGWMDGSLAVVAFVASAFFGAISGSSTATVAAIGAIIVPAMLEDGYPLDFSLATVACAGWLGVIIPPSIPMVLYGVSTGVSIGKLFLGGFIPGILLTFGMASYGIWWGRKHRDIIRRYEFSWREVGLAFKSAIGAIIMPLIVLGGIYAGVFTPTESAAVAVFYGLIVGFWGYKELTVKATVKILKSAVTTTAMILFVVAAASLFGYVMTYALIPTRVTNFIVEMANSKAAFLTLITILMLIVGTFMDTPPAILIMAPIIVPILPRYGIDPVAFGVIMVVNLGIGLTTPPVGMNLYVAAGLRKTSIGSVVNRHLVGYILCALVMLIIFLIFPGLISFLPDLMMK
jgi:C4-dicarboxylate transporter DctM subunit